MQVEPAVDVLQAFDAMSGLAGPGQSMALIWKAHKLNRAAEHLQCGEELLRLSNWTAVVLFRVHDK